MVFPIIIKAAEYAEATPKDRTRVQPFLIPLTNRNGFVFALASIDKQKPSDPTPLPIIEKHLEEHAENFDKDAHPQRKFELFLGSLNKELADQVRRGAWQTPINQFHSIVGIACEGSLFLSGTGELTALFLHRKNSTQRYQVFNLARSIQTEQALPTWEKPFAVVLDGDIQAGDALCLSNQDLLRNIEQEELNTILATLPPKSAVAKIRQYFPAAINLSLIILKGEALEIEQSDKATPLSHTSIESFEDTQEETQRILGESSTTFSMIKEKIKKRSDKNKTITDSIVLNKPSGKLKTLIIGSVTLLGQIVVSTGGLLKRPFKASGDTPMPSMKARPSIKKPKAWFKHLPKTSKGLFVGAGVCLIFLAIGGGLFLKQRQDAQILADYKASIASVEDLLTQTEGALIYKDRNKAQELVEKGRSQIENLTKTTTEQQETAKNLSLRFDGFLDSIRNIIRVQNPTQIGVLPNNTNGKTLVKNGPTLYVFDQQANIYSGTREANSLNKIELETGAVGEPIQAATDDNRILFLDKRPGLSQFDIKNSQTKVLDTDQGKSIWRALTVYNSRLYIVSDDAGEIQIKRAGVSGSGFGTLSSWIKTKTTDLSDASSIAIDSRIFLLKKNGLIVQFLEGNEIGWKNSTVDPLLTNATQLVTNGDSQFLYVLEPDTQRVVVFDKQAGTTLAQYQFQLSQNPISIAVDESTKTLFVLTSEELVSTPLIHKK